MHRIHTGTCEQLPLIIVFRQLFLFLPFFTLLFSACTEDPPSRSVLFLKTGAVYTADGVYLPVGGKIRIGIQASGGGIPLTYIRITRAMGSSIQVQIDRGIYDGNAGYDQDFVFAKDTAAMERWQVLVMNADRDTATASFTVYRGEGTTYGSITHIPSLHIGFQDNQVYGHFLDADNGRVYSQQDVSGNESEIDMLPYYYVTSGLPSPTLTCPGYTAASGYYPVLNSWPVKNTTLYDYKSTDNDLVSVEQFDKASNDSLLVTAYVPDKVSGNCKYCYTGKVIPFKTGSGKYGLIKVINADQEAAGSMELSIKIQK
jgi:hypothetical protein